MLIGICRFEVSIKSFECLVHHYNTGIILNNYVKIVIDIFAKQRKVMHRILGLHYTFDHVHVTGAYSHLFSLPKFI